MSASRLAVFLLLCSGLQAQIPIHKPQPSLSSSPAGATYHFVTAWGTYGSGSGQFIGPSGIVVGGAIYVVDQYLLGTSRVQMFNLAGSYMAQKAILQAWGDIAIGPGTDVVVNTQLKVLRLDSLLNDISAWWHTTYSIGGGMTVDPLGYVYTIGQGSKVNKFSSNGFLQFGFGAPGSGDGQFNGPEDVAVDLGGNIYVTDSVNQRIQKFDSTGLFLIKWGSSGHENGQFTNPKGIAVDLEGNVYVADADNDRVQKFDSNGQFITTFGTTGTGTGQFRHPYAIAVDSGQTVYVTDWMNARVQIWALDPSLAVTSPNGGESLAGGSSHFLTWKWTGAIVNVRLEVSTDGGQNYTEIIASTPNSGSYQWTVPSTPSATCLIRISEAGNGSYADVSDAPFRILSPFSPTIKLSRASLSFGAAAGGAATAGQPVVVSNTGAGTLAWTAQPSAAWVTLSKTSGSHGDSTVIGVNLAGLGVGNYSGSVAFSDSNATNSPQTVTVNLNVYGVGATAAPFGSFDSPVDGTTGVTGAIPVTGWVLDDIGVTKVEIWRDPVLSAGEVNSLYYIGDGLFIEGARPDVEAANPGYPMSYKAGWGYMLLTNFLPNHGNGIYKLYAIATDLDGHTMTLGTKTITCDNANAVKPFGTIDTPGQGETVGGTFYNFGWVLTPLNGTVPKDGHTITVFVDSVLLGNLSTPPNVYNAYRPDVSGNFPGLNNTGGPGAGEGGPVGAFSLNTTGYANGVHSIFWIAYDDLGRGEGIGSRFFNILNGNGAPEPALRSDDLAGGSGLSKPGDLMTLPQAYVPILVSTGLDLKAEARELLPAADGTYRVEIPEVDRVVMELGGVPAPGETGSRPGRTRYRGYMLAGGELRPLPIGSHLDSRTGRFSWMPGPGFVGTYALVFAHEAGREPFRVQRVRVEIRPKR